MLVDNRWRAGTGRGMRHRELGAGTRRPVLHGRDVLDDAATEVAVDLGHSATLPLGAAAPPTIHPGPRIGKRNVPARTPARRLRRKFSPVVTKIGPGTFRSV